MGHLADHVKEYEAKGYGQKEADIFHYLLGAIAGTIGYGGQTDTEKIANIKQLVEDFNQVFPSPPITKALRGEPTWK